MNEKRPALGITPKWLHNENRARDIINALIRFHESGKADENAELWVGELQDLVYEINSHRKELSEEESTLVLS